MIIWLIVIDVGNIKIGFLKFGEKNIIIYLELYL